MKAVANDAWLMYFYAGGTANFARARAQLSQRRFSGADDGAAGGSANKGYPPAARLEARGVTPAGTTGLLGICYASATLCSSTGVDMSLSTRARRETDAGSPTGVRC